MRTIFYDTILLCALFTFAFVGISGAQQVQTNTTADGGFFGFFDDTGTDNNFGGWTHVPVGVSNNETKRRSVFLFDIAGQIPAGATITGAVFEFDVQQQGGPQNQQGADFSLHRVTTDWDEGTGISNIGEPTFDGASWNEAKGGVPWDTPGGDFDSTSLGTVFVDALDGATDFQISSGDLIAAVQDILDNPADNYGFLLKNVNETLLGSAARVVSREGSGGTFFQSRLIIDYTNGGGATEVSAADLTLFRGVLVDGQLSDTFDSDDIRMRFNPGFTINSSEAPVWLIFDANLSTDSPGYLHLQVEAQAGTPGITATLEAWNWNTGMYDVVDVSATSFNSDSIVTVGLHVADHVDSGSAAVRSRLGWRKTGFTLNFPWETRLDQLVWIEPQP